MSLEGWSLLLTFVISVAGIMITMIKLMVDIKAELKPNHGSSARDAINRTEGNTDDTNKAIQTVIKDIGGLRSDIRRLSQVDDADRERAHETHTFMMAHQMAEYDKLYKHISDEISKLRK